MRTAIITVLVAAVAVPVYSGVDVAQASPFERPAELSAQGLKPVKPTVKPKPTVQGTTSEQLTLAAPVFFAAPR